MTQQELQDSTEDMARQAAKPESAVSKVETYYASIREELEKRHYGSYVMINIDTLDYVIAQTASMTHAKFIEKFGEDAHGWCTRIGVSVFATA